MDSRGWLVAFLAASGLCGMFGLSAACLLLHLISQDFSGVCRGALPLLRGFEALFCICDARSSQIGDCLVSYPSNVLAALCSLRGLLLSPAKVHSKDFGSLPWGPGPASASLKMFANNLSLCRCVVCLFSLSCV